MNSIRRVAFPALLAVAALAATPATASADITAFLGAGIGPETRSARGLSFGVTVLVVGFEIEYADISAKTETGATAPRIRTGMVNALVQTPTPGVQLYATAGAGGYRESLSGHRETSAVLNIGGGVKFEVLGPLRLRVDYRLLTLRGNPIEKRVHRVYAGLNASF